jgi:hypothetical protein
VIGLVTLKNILRKRNRRRGRRGREGRKRMEGGKGEDGDGGGNGGGEENKNNNKKTSTEVEPQAATSRRLPTWGPRQGRNTNIHPFVSPATGVEKSEAPHINKDSSPLSVLMFFTEIFHLLVEQTNLYYKQFLD